MERGLLHCLPDAPRKVALVRASRIGDFLCATPALRALRSPLPNAEISLVALPLVRDLARRSPQVDRFIAFPGFPGMAEHFFQPNRAVRADQLLAAAIPPIVGAHPAARETSKRWPVEHHVAVLITNDSGPAHIAYALCRPTVTLFGETDPQVWGPLECDLHHVGIPFDQRIRHGGVASGQPSDFS